MRYFPEGKAFPLPPYSYSYLSASENYFPVHSVVLSTHYTFSNNKNVIVLQRKIDPLQWLEQCRVVKTGDMAVDGHCMPSTIEGEMGEIIDKFRMDTHLVYHRCVKKCKALGIPISERVLKRGTVKQGTGGNIVNQ